MREENLKLMDRPYFNLSMGSQKLSEHYQRFILSRQLLNLWQILFLAFFFLFFSNFSFYFQVLISNKRNFMPFDRSTGVDILNASLTISNKSAASPAPKRTTSKKMDCLKLLEEKVGRPKAGSILNSPGGDDVKTNDASRRRILDPA
jgi:hypothetical protein